MSSLSYKIRSLINKDSDSGVWLANLRLEQKERPIVLKALNKSFAHNPESIDLFKLRSKAYMHIQNPSVLHLIDYGFMQSNFYHVTNHIKGFSLRLLIDTLSSKKLHLPLWFTLPVLYSVCQILRILQQNSVHFTRQVSPICRLNPSKMLITPKGTVHLTDTGIFTPFLLGTDSIEKRVYQAPELSSCYHDDIRADIYSIGAILWETVSGIAPASENCSNHESSVYSWLPESIHTFFYRSFNQDPKERYGSYEECAEAIRDVIREYKSKITHIEMANLLYVIFPESKWFEPSLKQLKDWIDKISHSDPEYYNWLNVFNKKYQSGVESQETISNPLFHISSVSPHESTKLIEHSSISILGLQKSTTTQIIKTKDLKTNFFSPFDKVTSSVKPVDIAAFQSDTTDTDGSSQMQDIWISTKTLRLSNIVNKSSGINSNDFAQTNLMTINNSTSDKIRTNYSKTADEINNNLKIGQDSFELGLSALKTKEYSRALQLFEEAFMKNPENKLYEINLSICKDIIKKRIESNN